jgi:hypothetical protein
MRPGQRLLVVGIWQRLHTTPHRLLVMRYDMDNMNDGSTNKVMTATQETNFETAYSHSQAPTVMDADVTRRQRNFPR